MENFPPKLFAHVIMWGPSIGFDRFGYLAISGRAFFVDLWAEELGSSKHRCCFDLSKPAFPELVWFARKYCFDKRRCSYVYGYLLSKANSYPRVRLSPPYVAPTGARVKSTDEKVPILARPLRIGTQLHWRPIKWVENLSIDLDFSSISASPSD